MPDLLDALAAAHDVAIAGGKIALRHFRRDPTSRLKADGTWVTEADWAVEAQIRLRLARAFPDHNILGEEEGLTAAGGGRPTEGAPTWVIDPIDGTNNYMAGIPIWGTLVGLQIDGESVVGVAHAPALAETYDAAKDAGARLNGEAIRVDRVPSLTEATFLYASYSSFKLSGLAEFFDALDERTYRSRGFGDFWGHMLVARGAAHLMVEARLSPWDVVALQPIVTEAGGRLTHLDGTEWTAKGSCVTTCGSIHEEVIELARSKAPGWREEVSDVRLGAARPKL